MPVLVPVAGTGENLLETLGVERKRWLCLLSMIFVGSMQGLVWITFSTNPLQEEEYYGWPCTPAQNTTACNFPPVHLDPDAVIDLLLNWGPIAYLIVMPLVMIALSQGGKSVWKTILWGASFTFAGSLVRLIPSFFSVALRQSEWTVFMLHVGQFLNGCAGPMAAGCTTAFSATWFPVEERTLATSVAYLPAVLGPSIGLIVAHLIVVPNDMELRLQLECAVSFLALVCWWFTPALPKRAPSVSALEARKVSHIGRKAALLNFWFDLKKVCSNRSFMVLALSGGLVSGVFNCWSASIPDSMSDSLSETMTQWLGFVANTASFVGNAAVGPLQQKFFAFRLKRLIILLFVLQIVGYFAFTLSLPLGTFSSTAILPLGGTALISVLCVASVCLGAAAPLFYELGAELTYPGNEGLSAGVVSLSDNAAGLVLLFVMPLIAKSWNSALMLCAVIIGAVLIFFVKEEYYRGKRDTALAETDPLIS
jgi:hypothetical protein